MSKAQLWNNQVTGAELGGLWALSFCDRDSGARDCTSDAP